MDEACDKHRMARLIRFAGLRSHTRYGRRPGRYGGRPAVVAPNLRQRQFAPTVPNKSWEGDRHRPFFKEWDSLGSPRRLNKPLKIKAIFS